MELLIGLIKVFLRYTGIFRIIQTESKEQEEDISKAMVYIILPFILIFLLIIFG